VWDAEKYEVKGIVSLNGEAAGEIDLHYNGKPSEFAGTLRADKKGAYLVTVYAYDKANGNTGLDNVTFIIQ